MSSHFLRQLPWLFARLDEQFVSPLLKPIQQGPQHRPVAFVRAATPITLGTAAPDRLWIARRGSRRDRRDAAALASELLSRDASRVQWFGRYHQLDVLTRLAARPRWPNLCPWQATSLRNLPGVEGFDNPRQSSHPCRVFPANLTSGGTMSAPLSRIRDGRAPGGRHHSVRRHLRARPDNGDAPLDPCARAAVQLGLNS